MRKLWLVLGCAGLAGGLLSLRIAQAQSGAPFDRERMDKELEIMKGIIQTSLAMVEPPADMTAGIKASWNASRIQAYYLHEQGAVFLLSLPRPHGLFDFKFKLGEWEEAFHDPMIAQFADSGLAEMQVELAEEQMRMVDEQVRMAEQAVHEAAFALAAPGEVPPKPPLPPETPAAAAPPAAPAPRVRAQALSEEKKEEVKQRMADLKARMEERKARQAETEQQYEQFAERMTEELIQLVGQYGDTLTGLKSDEHITFILTDREASLMPGKARGAGSGGQIITVKKSDVQSYKSGALTFSQFQGRVVQY